MQLIVHVLSITVYVVIGHQSALIVNWELHVIQYDTFRRGSVSCFQIKRVCLNISVVFVHVRV